MENYKRLAYEQAFFPYLKLKCVMKIINVAIFVKSDSSQTNKRILYVLIHFICEESSTIFIQRRKVQLRKKVKALAYRPICM